MAAMKNGKSALEYVREDMVEAEAGLMAADKVLARASLPDFKLCAAGGKDYHEAMAGGFRAICSASTAMIQWQRIQIEREMERDTAQPPSEKVTMLKTARRILCNPLAALAVIAASVAIAAWIIKS